MMGDPATVAQAYGVPEQSHRRGLRPRQRRLASRGHALRRILRLRPRPIAGAADGGLQQPAVLRPADRTDRRAGVGSLRDRIHLFAHARRRSSPAESYLGSVYQFAGYGDMLRLWVTPDQMAPFALLALLDQEQRRQHARQCRRAGIVVNAMPNGASRVCCRG